MEDHPPPTNDAKLLERLKPVDEDAVIEMQVSTALDSFNSEISEINSFCEGFGDKGNNIRQFKK